MIRATLSLLLGLLAACASTGRSLHPTTMDEHSHAEPTRARVTHLELDLTADFDRHMLSGFVELSIERDDPIAPLVLDTSGLSIERVRGIDGTLRTFQLGSDDPILGTPLTIELMPGDIRVRIDYATTEGADAVQWLTPEQTAAGRRPFLFTQGQAILTRTWIPLQDTPSVRATYAATIRTPTATDLTAVMSAEQREVLEPGVTRFRMSTPIPSYLIALAIGELERREISSRCAVWAEPPIVDGAAREFEDTEAMIQKCEELFGPYRWGRYDVLVLPPSFPFGGMENPCLTFATPTILAGDKSLVALIAHELAHSWSGNLVTNATWRDFWLNEGFTVYLEQRIIGAIYGEERARMETLIGLQGLEKELEELPDGDQVLHIDLSGRNPDDGMTAVPYDKGAAFLRRLEQLFGRERFDRFLQGWFDGHAFRSVTTDEFLAWLDAELLAPNPDQANSIDVATWVRAPGLPADNPQVTSPAFDVVDAARRSWLAGQEAGELDVNGWVTMQWLHFLNNMPELSPSQREELDSAFGLTTTGNSEVLTAWLELNLRAGWENVPESVDQRLEAFLLRVGRRKFLKPLYEALIATPAGARRAGEIYDVARPRYHSVATRTIDELLERTR